MLKRVFLGVFVFRAFVLQAAEIKYARGFSLEQGPGYELLCVKDSWSKATPGQRYALYPRDRPRPGNLPSGAQAVAVPISRVVLTSSTQAAFLALLKLQPFVVGISSAFRINDPEIAARVARGQIAEVSSGPEMSGGLNLETLALLKPDLVFCFPMGDPALETSPKLKEAGLQAVVDASFLEPRPLGRLEWVKFMAAFFGKSREAARVFNRIEKAYASLAAMARAEKSRPKVLLNTGFQGTWWVPPGGSYMAAYLGDAGADYAWKDLPGETSLGMNEERVFNRAQNADFWILTGTIASLAALAGSDPRLKLFKAYQDGQVYGCDAKVNNQGGNDFFEGGAARPDLVLKDLVRIFHPGLAPGHELIWYRKLK